MVQVCNFFVDDLETAGTGERFLSVLDIRRQMARVKYSLRPDEEATKVLDDDDQLFENFTLPRSSMQFRSNSHYL